MQVKYAKKDVYMQENYGTCTMQGTDLFGYVQRCIFNILDFLLLLCKLTFSVFVLVVTKTFLCGKLSKFRTSLIQPEALYTHFIGN